MKAVQIRYLQKAFAVWRWLHLRLKAAWLFSICKRLKAKGVSHKIGRYIDGTSKHFGCDGFSHSP